MDFANSLLQLFNNLWSLASGPSGYICNLKDNVESLRTATNLLKAKSTDVLAEVERQEGGGGVRRTEKVACWLDEVQKFVAQVDQILPEADERAQVKCLRRCLPPNCWSSYELGERVHKKLNKAKELQTNGGELGDVTLLLPSPPVLQMPMDETVGLDISFNEVWKWLVDERQVRTIGLYGVGGVGKTTLMKRINQQLLHAIDQKLLHADPGFEVVIWVVVSKQVNEDNIQDTIRKRLNIEDESWERWSREEKVHHLCEALTRKKFVLLLDDLWARLDLSKIGVPRHDRSKVVFTTRLRHVCEHMGADKTHQVRCLTSEGALKLFEKNVGKSLVHFCQEIRDLAKEIAKECEGLPLALITVGRAMATKDNLSEWNHALTTLRNKPHELSGMVEEVYYVLEFSYNSLNDKTLQRCFLYCCLFPEDYLIRTRDLIELWIGEGLLGDTDDVYRMRDKGESVLGDLKRACLLESEWDRDRGECVKMHDVIRDMATWIIRDHGQRENGVLVIEKEEDMSAKMISKWGEAKKVSLWGKWIQNIDQTPPECSQLKTLIVRETGVRLVPRGFFDSKMAFLTVLDLSDNKNIELFPEEICNLSGLQYLNLSGTRIRELPKEIKNLTCLQWLLLDYVDSPAFIPMGAIASLPLNVFSRRKLTPCVIKFRERLVSNIGPSPSDQLNEKEIIEELSCMQYLIDLSIDVWKSSSALDIFQSPNLQRCIKVVRIIDCQEELTRIVISYSPTGSSVFLHLKKLHLLSCRVLKEMEITRRVGQAWDGSCFPKLVQVWVEKCGLLDLSWLAHAPKLECLIVKGCDSMEKIISDGFAPEDLAASGLFSCLDILMIEDLPSLTSIYDRTLPFPQLRALFINGCPRLRRLPVDSNSARERLFHVKVEEDWWAKLEWEDDATRAYFTAKAREGRRIDGFVDRW